MEAGRFERYGTIWWTWYNTQWLTRSEGEVKNTIMDGKVLTAFEEDNYSI